MKTRFIIIFSLVLFTYANIRVYSQITDSTWTAAMVYTDPDTIFTGLINANLSQDQVVETVWMEITYESTGGIPYDIIYVDDDSYGVHHVFVYTERKLLAYEVDEPQFLDVIDISESGSQFTEKLTQPLLSRSREKHLAYDPDKHELYCLTQDLKILRIDPEFPFEILGEIIPDTDIELVDWAILKYDPYSHYLFLGVCRNYDSQTAELMAFNTDDYDQEYSIDDLGILNDFTFNPVDYKLYLSNYYEIRVVNSLDGSTIISHYLDDYMGIIFNAYNSNTGLNKIFCLPESIEVNPDNALVFNGTNTSYPQHLSLERGYFGCGIYNSPTNQVYLGYSSTDQYESGFISFNVYNTGNMTYHPLGDNDIIMDMVNIEDRVFISSRDNIYLCRDGTFFPNYTLNSPKRYFYRLISFNSYSHPFIQATNLMDQSLQRAYAPSTLSNTEWFEPEYISGVAYQGFFNQVDQKLYLYNEFDDDHHFMYIYTPGTEGIQAVDIFQRPTGTVLDEDNNIIYISTLFNNIIRRYNATDNEWLIPVDFPEGYSLCNELYLLNGKLFCSALHEVFSSNYIPAILIYDIETSLTEPEEIITVPGFNPGENLYVTHFTCDDNDRVYLSIRQTFTPSGRMIRINEDLTFTDVGANIDSPDEILYDELNNKILMRHLGKDATNMDEVTIIDFESYPPSTQSFHPREGLDIIDMEIDPVSNLIYFNYNDPLQNGYIDIYTTAGTLVHTIQVGYRAMALKYNPANNYMYAHVQVNFTADRKEQLWSIDPAFNVYSLDLGQNEGIWRNYYRLKDLILDVENNKIYSVSAHGNIKTVQCHADQIQLSEGWNWISFPRLDRDNNDPVLAQPVLENIDPFPDHLSMTNLPPQEEEEEILEFNINNTPPWSGDLTFIQSTRGYKLETSNTELSFLPMEGTQLDPAYPISIYEGYENWVGYYPTWQQDPFDALAEVLDELTLIKHHDWACVKEWGYMPPDGNLKPYWICWNKKPLKYADMVVLETTEDITFQWGDGTSGTNQDLLSTDYFSYDEKQDYTPIFIDLDSADNPVEIGAFIADSCIGASVVEEGDTLVMIRGYMPDDTAGEITFQEYYGATKSASGSIGDYYVLNTERRVREKRIIHSGENKKYYHVSFTKEDIGTDEITPLILSIFPNPCQDLSRIDYFIPGSSRVEFEILDVFGRKVSEILMGDMAAGHYTMLLGEMNTNSLSPGIYLVRMSACGNTAIKKILINR